MLRLETRGVDENELGIRAREYAGDAVAGGLRLARRNAYFLPDEEIEQSRFADVRPPDDCDRSRAMYGIGHSCAVSSRVARS
jgi:hypothetical protein